jgi:di/tricarboxylate transporter
MGAGQYHFKDYAKAGVPLVVITMALSLIFLPLLFPF